MDPDRAMPLTDAALLAACSRKSLERRAERGSLPTMTGDDGRRVVRVRDLMRAGLLTAAPVHGVAPGDPSRIAQVEDEAGALRVALTATEAALARARGEAVVLRLRVKESEARAACAEDELTRLVTQVNAPAATPRRARGRLRSA
jgi:hypothetical protein